MSPTAYILQQDLTVARPGRWRVQPRYACRLPDEAISLPAGTWLLALPAVDGVPLYRLANGEVVAGTEPLTAIQATPLTDPQALAALTAYRPLASAIAADWGVQPEQVAALPPFRLIQCPLCGGTALTTVAFAAVWCDGCHANFQVRNTAGDPGFVVDCTWPYLQESATRYLLPRSDDLLLTMVYKHSGDPLDHTHTRHCHRPDCTPVQVALTDGKDGPLRAGLHACALGDVYDWSFYGRVPAVYDLVRHGAHELVWPDGRRTAWPQSACMPVTGLPVAARQQLHDAISLLTRHAPPGRFRDSVVTTLQSVADRPSSAPYLPGRSPWPHRRALQPGEKYVLYRWLLSSKPEDGWQTAVPVWLVVTAVPGDCGRRTWQVVRDNLCPGCGQAVTAADLEQTVAGKRPWQLRHGHCRTLWHRHKWQPTLFDA